MESSGQRCATGGAKKSTTSSSSPEAAMGTCEGQSGCQSNSNNGGTTDGNGSCGEKSGRSHVTDGTASGRVTGETLVNAKQPRNPDGSGLM